MKTLAYLTTKLLVDVYVDRILWAAVTAGVVEGRGVAATFDDLASIAKIYGATFVLIEDGFRTGEVRAAASKYKWATTHQIARTPDDRVKLYDEIRDALEVPALVPSPA